MLQEKTSRQVKIGMWQLIMGIGYIIGGIVMATSGLRDAYGNSGPIPTGWWIGIVLIVISGISQFVLWIAGIVNAVQINGQTGNDTLLVVFAIFTFWFVHLIIAISVKNKYAGVSMPARKSAAQGPSTSHSYEAKLKESFTSGVITSAEYEKKLKEHRSKK